MARRVWCWAAAVAALALALTLEVVHGAPVNVYENSPTNNKGGVIPTVTGTLQTTLTGPLLFTPQCLPQKGDIEIDLYTGNFKYTPAENVLGANAIGQEVFTYQVEKDYGPVGNGSVASGRRRSLLSAGGTVTGSNTVLFSASAASSGDCGLPKPRRSLLSTGVQADVELKFFEVNVIAVNDGPRVDDVCQCVDYTSSADILIVNSEQNVAARKVLPTSPLSNQQRLYRQLEPASGRDDDNHFLVYSIVQEPANGLAWFDNGLNTSDPGNSWFNYVPNPGHRTGDSFRYQVTDCSASNTALIDLGPTYDPQDVNQWNPNACIRKTYQANVQVGSTVGLPNVFDGVTLTDEDKNVTGVMSRLSTTDQEAVVEMYYEVVDYPKNGTISFPTNFKDYQAVNNATQQTGCPFVYLPDKDFYGQDSFTFRVVYGVLESNVATQQITVNSINDRPVKGVGYEQQFLVVPYTFNDGDPVWDGDKYDGSETTTEGLVYTHSSSAVVEDKDGKKLKREIFNIQVTDPDSSSMTLTLFGWNGVGDLIDLDSCNATALGVITCNETAVPVANYSVPMWPSLTADRTFVKTFAYMAPAGVRGPLSTLGWFATDEFGLRTSGNGKLGFSAMCPHGYQITGDRQRCIPCPKGKYASVFDTEECVPCQAGTFTDIVGSAQCPMCPLNQWQDETGQTRCRKCPKNKSGDKKRTSVTVSPGSTALTDCLCAAADPNLPITQGKYGYFGPPGERCEYCVGPSAADLDVPEGAELPDEYWVACDSIGQRWPHALPGYFVNICADPPTIEGCSPKDSCLGAKTDAEAEESREYSDLDEACMEVGYVDGTCASKYIAQGCRECVQEPQHYRLEGECFKCPESSGTLFGIIIGAGIIVFAPILFKLTQQVKDMPGITEIFSSFQMMSIFSISFDWPDMLKPYLEGLSFFSFNLELTHPECQFNGWDFATKWTFMCVLPFCIAGFFCFILFVQFVRLMIRKLIEAIINARIALQQRMKQGRARNALGWVEPPPPLAKGGIVRIKRCWYGFGQLLQSGPRAKDIRKLAKLCIRAQLTFLHVFYVPMSRTAFELFDCTKDLADGKYYLDSDPSVECNSDDKDDAYNKLKPWAILSIVMYPIGIYVLLGGLLYATRKDRNQKATQDMLGFLFIRYEPQWYAFELAVKARKVLLVGMFMLMSGDDLSTQMRKFVMGILILLAAMMLQFYAAPYDSIHLDRIAACVLFTEFFTLFAGLIFLADDNEQPGEEKISEGFRKFLIVMTFIMFIVSAIFLFFFLILDIFPKAHKKLGNFREILKERKERKKKIKEAEKRLRAALKANNEPVTFFDKLLATCGCFGKPKGPSIRAQIKKAKTLANTPEHKAARKLVRNLRGVLTKETAQILHGLLVQKTAGLSPVDKSAETKELFTALVEYLEGNETIMIKVHRDFKIADVLKDSSRDLVYEGLAARKMIQNERLHVEVVESLFEGRSAGMFESIFARKQSTMKSKEKRAARQRAVGK